MSGGDECGGGSLHPRAARQQSEQAGGFAGLVGQLRSSASITQVLRYSVGLYDRLKDETGLETGWKMTGCLRLATTQERWIEFRRTTHAS